MVSSALDKVIVLSVNAHLMILTWRYVISVDVNVDSVEP